MAKQTMNFQSNDPEMDIATAKARQSFKYLWRELSWEYRRLIPALSFYAIKAAFSDENIPDDGPNVEHMWVNELDYDGTVITGVLNNDPNWVQSVSAGDSVHLSLDDLTDWMFCCQGAVYGGFTVNLMRSRMSADEMASHDEAWGVEFGDALKVPLVVRTSEKSEVDEMIEHPMSINMGESLKKELEKSDKFVKYVDEDGFTMLHREALAGNATGVKLLLEYGADASLKNKYGQTAKDLADAHDWQHVIALLQ